MDRKLAALSREYTAASEAKTQCEDEAAEYSKRLRHAERLTQHLFQERERCVHSKAARWDHRAQIPARFLFAAPFQATFVRAWVRAPFVKLRQPNEVKVVVRPPFLVSWAVQAERFRNARLSVAGDAALCAEFLAYGGPFQAPVRSFLQNSKWIPDLISREVKRIQRQEHLKNTLFFACS